MHSPFLITDLQGNLVLAPNIFILLVAIATSTLHLAILTNNTLNRIDTLRDKNDIDGYGDKINKEQQLSFWKTFFRAVKKLGCLFLFCFSWIICCQKGSIQEGTNKARQLAYAKKFRDEVNSVMFTQISIIVFILLRIALFSLFGLEEVLWYDLLIVVFAFLALGFFWPLVFLKITYGSEEP